MKIIKQLNIAAITVVMTLCISCTSSKNEKTNKGFIQSFELGVNSMDTINMIDSYGYKQGKWVPTLTNKLKDTLYYKNDTIIN